jgi:hypothetical protein
MTESRIAGKSCIPDLVEGLLFSTGFGAVQRKKGTPSKRSGMRLQAAAPQCHSALNEAQPAKWASRLPQHDGEYI